MTKLERLIHRGDVQLVDRHGTVIGKLSPFRLSSAVTWKLEKLARKMEMEEHSQS